MRVARNKWLRCEHRVRGDVGTEEVHTREVGGWARTPVTTKRSPSRQPADPTGSARSPMRCGPLRSSSATYEFFRDSAAGSTRGGTAAATDAAADADADADADAAATADARALLAAAEAGVYSGWHFEGPDSAVCCDTSSSCESITMMSSLTVIASLSLSGSQSTVSGVPGTVSLTSSSSIAMTSSFTLIFVPGSALTTRLMCNSWAQMMAVVVSDTVLAGLANGTTCSGAL
jgi:hypothetical protein